MSVWCNVFSQNFQMSLKPPSASHEEDSSLDGYDPGQETTARSSPYHLSDGALSGHTEEHCTWDRQLEYILACCSFVNGIDTFLWFPKMAATYGGGTTWLMNCWTNINGPLRFASFAFFMLLRFFISSLMCFDMLWNHSISCGTIFMDFQLFSCF